MKKHSLGIYADVIVVLLVMIAMLGLINEDRNRGKQVEELKVEVKVYKQEAVKNHTLYEMANEAYESTLKLLRESEAKAAKERASRTRQVPQHKVLRSTPHKVNMGSLNWAALRECENSGKYTSSSGDYYRGAYQFDQGTWNGVAGRHLPSWVGVDPARAPASVQDAMAMWLYRERGKQPWPVCGKKL